MYPVRSIACAGFAFAAAALASVQASAATTPCLSPGPDGAAWALMFIGISGVGALARTRTQAATAGRGVNAA